MLAVVPVRFGELTLGGDETVAEAGGRAILVGTGAREAAGTLGGIATDVRTLERSHFQPDAWSRVLAAVVAAEHVVVLPGSPDGRDLAPRLARLLGRPLLAGATEVRLDGAVVANCGGLAMDDLAVDGPFVATLQPGARVPVPVQGDVCSIEDLDRAGTDSGTNGGIEGQAGSEPDPGIDAEVVGIIAADPATIDLGEATRVVTGGAGMGSTGAMERLGNVATALGASLGATRVVTDLGWAPADRQIGTTGVTVDPDLYVAIGVSGAVQHVNGIGEPTHVVAVNTDPSCPMMALADLALVTDGVALVEALERALVSRPAGEAPDG